MKRLVWYSKVGFLLMALFLTVGGYTDRIVGAQDEGFEVEAACNINKWCGWTSGGGCRCSNGGSDCKGCFVSNGDTGCGKCDYGNG